MAVLCLTSEIIPCFVGGDSIKPRFKRAFSGEFRLFCHYLKKSILHQLFGKNNVSDKAVQIQDQSVFIVANDFDKSVFVAVKKSSVILTVVHRLHSFLKGLSLIRRTKVKKLSHKISCAVKMPLPIFPGEAKMFACVSADLCVQLFKLLHQERSGVLAQGQRFLIVVKKKSHRVIVVGNDIADGVVGKTEHKYVFSEDFA